jgi:DNA-directed RNA polymerase III subunit RPC8
MMSSLADLRLPSDPVMRRWFWYPDDDERILSPSELLNTVVASRLYIDPGEPFRFRVDSVQWQDIRPEPSSAQQGQQANGDVEEGKGRDPIEKAGYKILVRQSLCRWEMVADLV